MYDYLKPNFEAVEQEIAEACEKAGRSRDSVTLITVTKTYPTELLQAVLDLGYTSMGENRPQEVMEKAPELVGDADMHLIGQLQTNKVRKIIPLVNWIHSIDRVKLLNKVDTIAGELGKRVKILVQVNTSAEQSKSGCTPEDAIALCEAAAQCENIDFCGLMTIGPLGGAKEENRASFQMLAGLGDKVKHLCVDEKCELSMGMSGDFAQAIAEGATMIRVGSRIVGARNYA